ncbi:uncharacterized protein L969DRAFT_95778 [Mixia osmundae IAM 14324]|uniref:uncharacterized protein n=1 Tax=Mixia osmundae (strain CBS 9802 / IAM 14324 / JCM 22182 / KY 12970) TaxID=764103 RepID=UPI0004A554F4|nr:uncharacterized protein L969DRAFT_95778 [Mixia osmundae IAM 14324]KEI37928.1 hypothetical protein L969DRAFT_95778 [Mixia osmundae IAM 14324]
MDVQQQQNARGNFGYVLVIILIFWLMSNSQDAAQEEYLRTAIGRRTHERDALIGWIYGNATSYQAREDALLHDNSTGPLVDEPADAEVEGRKAYNYTLAMPNFLFAAPELTALTDALQLPAPASTLYYHNVTGFLKGSWRPINVSLPLLYESKLVDDTLNETVSVPKPPPAFRFNRTLSPPAEPETMNISKAEAARGAIVRTRGYFPWNATEGGRISINVRQNLPWLAHADLASHPRLLKQEVARTDVGGMEDLSILRGSFQLDNGERGIELDIEGVHKISNGSFYFIAAPSFMGLDPRMLPALAKTSTMRNLTAKLIVSELDDRIRRAQASLDEQNYPSSGGSPTQDGVYAQTPTCTFIGYGQLGQVVAANAARLDEFESEMSDPTGVSTVPIKARKSRVIMYSETCQLVIEIDDLSLLHMETFWAKAKNYAAFVGLVAVIQTYLLIHQMESTSTPTSVAKVAYGTITMQVGMDVYFFIAHLTLGVVTDNDASLALIVPAFLACCSGLLFGLRYAAIIKVATTPASRTAPVAATPVVIPQPAISADGQPPSATAAQSTIEDVNEDSAESAPLLPVGTPAAPVSATLPPAPRIARPWYLDEDSAMWFILFAGSVTAVLIAVLFFGWVPILIAALYSYWCPQILRNAEKGQSRRTLKKRYIYGTMICRLSLPLYAWGCPDNVLFTETSPWVILLTLWQLTQVATMLLQDILGARFFLPKDWYPEQNKWDYHPALPPVDAENAQGSIDCVICLEKIDFYSTNGMRDDEKGVDALATVGRAFNRFNYMVPPCHHIAHTHCLESWLAIKFEWSTTGPQMQTAPACLAHQIELDGLSGHTLAIKPSPSESDPREQQRRVLLSSMQILVHSTRKRRKVRTPALHRPQHIMRTSRNTISAGLILGAIAQAAAQATTEQLALVQAQYEASGFVTPIGNSLSFGIDFTPEALLTVVYPQGAVVNGHPYTATEVAELPSFTLLPASGQASTLTGSDARYTLMLADAAAIGDPDPQGDYRHFLVNYLTLNGTAAADGSIAFNPSAGNVVTNYAGPGPNAGEGAHRYAWLMFSQPSAFAAPTNLTTPNSGPGHWYVQSYVQSTGLGSLIAASFFTVQNGVATFTAAATSSINTATLAGASASATGSASSTSGAATASNTSSSKASTNGASGLQAGSASASLVLLALGAYLCA